MKKKYKILFCFTILTIAAVIIGYNSVKDYNREFAVETISDEEAELYDSGGSLVIDGLININTADAALLATLDGIGDITAQRIVDYRSENGLFKSVEDIMIVQGIGEGKFNAVKDKICCKDNNSEMENGQ